MLQQSLRQSQLQVEEPKYTIKHGSHTLESQLSKQEKTAYGRRREKYQPTPTNTHHPSTNSTAHHQPLPAICSLARTLAGATYSLYSTEPVTGAYIAFINSWLPVARNLAPALTAKPSVNYCLASCATRRGAFWNTYDTQGWS
jgi:hypothetical protein